MRAATALLMAALQGIHCAPVRADALVDILSSPQRRLRLTPGAPALAPLAHTRFCLNFPEQCEPRGPISGEHRFALTPKRRAELEDVNRRVNHTIVPLRSNVVPTSARWLIAPNFGNCADYAVTKRGDLLARGWPSDSLLLAEVIAPGGQHHLVLVIRGAAEDLVADSLTDAIRPWSKTPYVWLRMQSPENPWFWTTCAAGPQQ